MKKLLLILLLCTTCFASNEIRAYYESGQTLYAVIRNSSGQAFDTTTSAFESWNVMTDYDITLTDKTGGMYLGDFDTDVPEGSYTIMVHFQAGGSPSDSDPPIQYEEGRWEDSSWYSTRDRLENIVVDSNELQTDWTNGGRLDLLIDAIKKYTDLIVILETDVNDVNDAGNFTVTDGNSVADKYNGSVIMIQDATDSVWETKIIEDWDTDLEVTLDTDLSFTPESGDLAYIIYIYYGNIWERIQNLGSVTNIIDTTSGSGASRGLGTTRFDAAGEDP